MKEKLSAMMDGELSEHEQAQVLAELSRDPKLRKTWERFQIIRAALSKELDVVVSVDLGDRIFQRGGELVTDILYRRSLGYRESLQVRFQRNVSD